MRFGFVLACLGAALFSACESTSVPLGDDDAGDGAAPFACDGSGVTKGPWVQAVGETHATMRWETCRPGTSNAVTVTGGAAPSTAVAVETAVDVPVGHTAPLNPSAPPDVAGRYFMHEASLDGLAPSTCYDYALSADLSRAGRFCTAKPSGAPLRFVAIGDTNVGIGPMATDILSHVMPMDPDFLLHLGDIEYYDSGFDTWQLWFDVMRPALAHGAIFPAIGNHESETPDEYANYTLRFFAGEGFDGNDEYYDFEDAGVWFFVLDTQDATDGTSAQASWFAQRIAQVEQLPGYRMAIVYFHKPFVTCGDTGDDPVARQYFEPLFRLHKVPLVLQAHMHGYERFDFGGLTYVTTAGGGGAIGDPNKNVSRDYCNQRVASGGFFHATVFDVGASSVKGTVVDDQGVVRDSFDIPIP